MATRGRRDIHDFVTRKGHGVKKCHIMLCVNVSSCRQTGVRQTDRLTLSHIWQENGLSLL